MKRNCNHNRRTKVRFLRIAAPFHSHDDRYEVWLVRCEDCAEQFEEVEHRPGQVLDLRLLNDCLKGLGWGMVSIFSGLLGTSIPEHETAEYDILHKLRQSRIWRSKLAPDIRLDRALVVVRRYNNRGEHEVVGVFVLDSGGLSENMVNILEEAK